MARWLTVVGVLISVLPQSSFAASSVGLSLASDFSSTLDLMFTGEWGAREDLEISFEGSTSRKWGALLSGLGDSLGAGFIKELSADFAIGEHYNFSWITRTLQNHSLDIPLEYTSGETMFLFQPQIKLLRINAMGAGWANAWGLGASVGIEHELSAMFSFGVSLERSFFISSARLDRLTAIAQSSGFPVKSLATVFGWTETGIGGGLYWHHDLVSLGLDITARTIVKADGWFYSVGLPVTVLALKPWSFLIRPAWDFGDPSVRAFSLEVGAELALMIHRTPD